MKKIFFFLASYLIFGFNYLFSEEKMLKFVALGHIYPIIDNTRIMENLINKINSHQPDFVFILGDSKLHDLKYLNMFKSKIDSKIYFSPGNHELSKFRKEYEKNVGYLNTVIKTQNVQFLLINSSDDKKNIISFLEKNLEDNFEGYRVILTHHRIWDDTLISPNPYGHDKSFYFEDVYPLIKNKVNAIIAGNSKRQHFRDLTDDKFSFGKQNVNLIYWLDKIGDIELYAVGMGDGEPKANFIVAEIKKNNMLVKGDYTSIEKYDVLPRELVESNQLRFTIHNTKAIRELVKERYFLINKKKTFLLTIILFLVIFYLIFRVKKNEKKL